eukprot:1207072-Pyramimonas_sp.AAC.1
MSTAPAAASPHARGSVEGRGEPARRLGGGPPHDREGRAAPGSGAPPTASRCLRISRPSRPP